ncbi:hypothetical protein BC835DRAFT_584725 [Cytidiella melzeri]|nr:hypothetical protein BC835DRAFT_584725 [Cytidiella melzeri]
MHSPGPSHIITITGTVVGLLDPTQATRLLSAPGSRLSFATFHPRTASAGSRQLSTQDELCSQKRVVIETLPSGENFWRWVPRAKGVDTVAGEGTWPRVINICGQAVECSQEQWDIYKLDTEYECIVRPSPELTTITRREPQQTAESTESFPTDMSRHKRRVEDEFEDSMPQTKKKRPILVETEVEGDSDDDDDTDSDEEDAVEEMIIDDAMPGVWNERKRQFREQVNKSRKRRREKTAAKSRKLSQPRDPQDASDLSMIDLTIDEAQTPTPPNSITSQASTAFSQTSTAFSQTSAPSNMHSTGSQKHATHFFVKRSAEPAEAQVAPTKRTRTRSPSPTFAKKFHPEMKEVYKRKKQELQKSRMRKGMERLTKRKEAQQRALEEAIRASAQPTFTSSVIQPNADHIRFDRTTSSHSPPQRPNGVEDPISLEEKIRRMAEINAYEEARVAKEIERQRAEQANQERQRKQEELRAREKIRLEREARERAAELERRRQLQQEEQERRKREQEREELRRKTQQQQDRWSYGPWTTQRALERYKVLSEAFDAAQFTPENPITFLTVPWPVLHKPTKFTIEDVDWGAVEGFFKAVRSHMRSQDYNALVEKSHRRFHPDRWRARRVLQSVQDDDLKACLEVAANTVAQALTPLWREVKSS